MLTVSSGTSSASVSFAFKVTETAGDLGGSSSADELEYGFPPKLRYVGDEGMVRPTGDMGLLGMGTISAASMMATSSSATMAAS